MPALNLIDSNPFVESYKAAEQETRQQAAADQTLKNQQQQYDMTAEQRPFKLRDVQSTAEFNATKADVAKQTAPFDVQKSQSGAAEAQTKSDQARFDLDQHQKNDNFVKSLEYLNKGDIASARAYAERNGTPIPDALLNDTNSRQALKEIEEQAKLRYPDRPNDQVAFITAKIKELAGPGGTLRYDPVAIRGQPSGIAAPPAEKKDTTPSGSLAGRTLTERYTNILLTGDPNSPEYAAVYAYLAKPRVQFDPNTGEAIMVSPDMSWARRPGSGGGARAGVPMSGMPGGGATPTAAPPVVRGYAPEGPTTGQPTISTAPGRSTTATRATFEANMNQAQRDLGVIESTFFPNGQFDRGTVLAGQTGFPGSKGREGQQAIERTIEILLRERTGAAAPAEEVKHYASMFTPSVLDSDEGARRKLAQLRAFFDDSRRIAAGRLAGGGGSGAGGAPQPNGGASNPARFRYDASGNRVSSQNYLAAVPGSERTLTDQQKQQFLDDMRTKYNNMSPDDLRAIISEMQANQGLAQK